MTIKSKVQLSFVTCADRLEILGARLLSSPCLQRGGNTLVAHFNVASAAQGFNAAMATMAPVASASSWLVWVHQDVFLPIGWDDRFTQALELAQDMFPRLAVAGIYGVVGAGAAARRAGHLLDRGILLREPAPLPCLVDSLDELLFAVRVGSNLRLDPALGFDFYATDLVLQAQQQGWQCAVLDAYCEHWSDTPSSGAVPPAVVQRIQTSARVFEAKWVRRMPITTPCFNIAVPGDVAASVRGIVKTTP